MNQNEASEAARSNLSSVLGRIELQPVGDAGTGSPDRGLTQLVLTLVRLIHELLERQAIQRLEAGTLSDDEIERVGSALQAQAQELHRLCETLDLKLEDLNLDLGPLGHLV
ncbi:MAG: gas vesicle protein K [Acidobacteriota bacterium]